MQLSCEVRTTTSSLSLVGRVPGAENGLHVRDHGFEDLGTMSHSAKKVGNVAASMQVAIIDFGKIRRNFGAIEAADARHGWSSLRLP